MSLVPPVPPTPATNTAEDRPGDGGVIVTWPSLQEDARPQERHEALAKRLKAGGLGQWMLRNPAWRLFPPQWSLCLARRARTPPYRSILWADVPWGRTQPGVVDPLGCVLTGALDE
jgi:hypothetical protein